MRRRAVQVVVLAAAAMVVGLLTDQGDSLGSKFAVGVIMCGLWVAVLTVADRWHRRYPPIDRDPNELHAPPNVHATWPVTRL